MYGKAYYNVNDVCNLFVYVESVNASTTHPPAPPTTHDPNSTVPSSPASSEYTLFLCLCVCVCVCAHACLRLLGPLLPPTQTQRVCVKELCIKMVPTRSVCLCVSMCGRGWGSVCEKEEVIRYVCFSQALAC